MTAPRSSPGARSGPSAARRRRPDTVELAYRLGAEAERTRHGHPAAGPRWARGSKTLGLLELLRAGLPVPETVVLDGERLLAGGAAEPGHLSPFARAAVGAAIAAREESAGQALGDARAPRPLVLAIRCGDKHVDRTLPETLIHIGCPDAPGQGLPASAIAERDAQAARVTGALGIAGEPARLRGLSPGEQVERVVSWMLRGLTRAAPGADRALLLQRMVHGNLGPRSCAGTAYTRNPYTGERMDYGRYLLGVTGPRLVQLYPDDKRDLAELASDIPDAYRALRGMLDRLEAHHQDVRFVEFIIEEGDVYLLQNTVRNRRPGLLQRGGQGRPEERP